MVNSLDMKKFFKNFVEDFKNSLYGGDYKGHFADRKFSTALKYVFKLVSIEMLVVIIFSSVFLFPAVKLILDRDSIVDFVDTHMPADKSIEIKEGRVITSDGEPIFINAPDRLKETGVEYFVVIDPSITTTENIIQLFETYNTANLITSNMSVTRNETGSVEITSLKNYPDFLITNESILGIYEKARPFVFVLIPLMVIFGFIFGTIFRVIFSLFLALIISLGVLLISRFKKIDLNFKQAYIISMYAITITAIISVIQSIIKADVVGFILMVALTLLLVIVNLKNKKTADYSADN